MLHFLKFRLPVFGAIFIFSHFLAQADPPATFAPGDNDALDFLVMNVCVDEHDRPTLQNPLNTNPAVPKSSAQRNIRPGELLPYSTDSWTTPARKVSRRYCLLGNAVGTDQNGNRYPLVICWTDHTGDGQWSPRNNVSVMTVMDGYASDMGSTGGSHLSVNFGDGYLNPENKGIARFNKAWVFFPRKLIPENEVSYGVFSEQLANFSREEFSPEKLPPPAPVGSPSPSHLRSYFSVQAHQHFGFGPDSSIQLDTLVENKYSSRDEAGLSPGSAGAMERCYFTRELGESRWEAWKRDDAPMDPVAKASALYAQGACGLPASFVKTNITPHFVSNPVQVVPTPTGHAYGQVVTAWDDKAQRMVEHRWYLVDCADWTHVQVQSPFDPLAVVETRNDLLKDLLGLFVGSPAR